MSFLSSKKYFNKVKIYDPEVSKEEVYHSYNINIEKKIS